MKAIETKIKAGYAGLYVVAHESGRVMADIKKSCEKLNREMFAWTVTTGISETVTEEPKKIPETEAPNEMLAAFHKLPDDAVLLASDFHLFLADPNPVLYGMLKDAVEHGRAHGKVLIVLACRKVLPPEIEREFTVVEFDLPARADLLTILRGIIKSADIKQTMAQATVDGLIDGALGMTSIEAENAFALWAISGDLRDTSIVADEKATAISKGGMIEVVRTGETLESIGGLDALKAWILRREKAFTPEAQKYGLPLPKGILMVGVPGTGKSLTAKAVAAALGRPLLKLDAGKLFGSLVGQSEANAREAIKVAEAIAPCVLWIDEIEKGFGGAKSSNSTDGGTSARVFGSFLTWMQDKKSSVFVVATANDVSQLPPEFLRKGRFDEMFFVDLPNESERAAIWDIQIRAKGRDPKKFKVAELARASSECTGAEIEAAVVEALYEGFAENREPVTADISAALAAQVPLSRTMGERIGALQTWAKGRCRMATAASASDASTKGGGRKINL